jgi:hypothetical protein
MGILFFNWYGYQLLSSFLQERANARLEARLDQNNYDESQLVSVKIPITTLSYYNNATGFERIDGQVEINGIQYKYVKRRIFKDSLELLCIPNQASMSLQTAKNDFFRQVNDLQQHSPQGKKAPATYKSFSSSDYDKQNDLFVLNELPPSPLPISFEQVAVIPSSYVLTAEQPPDLFAAHC